MSIHKITPFLSDIKTFFKNSDMTAAMQNISSILSQVRMTERDTLAVRSKRNCVYPLMTVFQILILFPCFGIKNAWRCHKDGTLEALVKARKDVFYRFMENPHIDWRKALWHISVQLWKRIHVRSDYKAQDVCLILDDTDHEKTGRTIEKIGRVHSHVAHKAVLGFKCLCMAVTDGVSQILLDFDIIGEKGKKGNYGMSAKELGRRHQTEHNSEVLRQREKAYDMSKLELAKDMIRRAIRKGIKFSYVLADSWFTNKDIIRFIHSRHIKCHWLGMIKVGENGRTKYRTEYGEFSAPALVKLGKKHKLQKYSRKLKCNYIIYDAIFGGIPVRIFLVRRTQHGKWNGLLTTDTSLDFIKAWQIYSRRWALEVVFKDCKTNLGFGKCQSTSFASQIAAATLCCIQYNILSVARRFSDYETIGGLFREISKETVQLSVAQQIWGMLQELVTAIARAFGLLDEEIYDAVINKSEEIAHIAQFYNLKSAS
ncbi:MAG: transposase [Agathobacter sp.]